MSKEKFSYYGRDVDDMSRDELLYAVKQISRELLCWREQVKDIIDLREAGFSKNMGDEYCKILRGK